ncbi:MAG: hypothetical protein CR991_09635 [Proteobacteria bacterium]|nr:MAG: hypothetical protein CR991_09635 [Pseudomonadota bacterium]
MKFLLQYGLIIAFSLYALVACQAQSEAEKFRPGLTDRCVTLPAFMAQTGLKMPIAIDSRQQAYMGLRLVESTSGETWQHPSWDDAGHVGAFVRDRHGHIYVAATPEVSLTHNPPELQNRIYRIDTKTGVMRLWLDLPGEKPSAAHPLGVMGLAYDCDTDSLYVSSIAGSNGSETKGRIYRIAVASGEIMSTLPETDVIGLGVFNDVCYKRLYLGAARSPDVYSVVLDHEGNFTRQLRHEFSLAALPEGNVTNAKKFSFRQAQDRQYVMQVKEVNFGFRLMAENNPYKRVYNFIYQASDDAWSFRGTTPEAGF